MFIRFIAIFAAFIVTFPSQAREIINPDDVQIDLLYRFLASDPPDFASEAKKSYEVRSANEFDRPNVARQIENNMRRDFDLMKDVDVIRIRTRAKLSEYDGDRGGFYISALNPGTYFKYGNIQYTFENTDEFHLWEVPVGDARYIVEQLGYGRDVVVDIKTRPFAVDAVRGRKLRTQVIGLDIYSQKTNQQFASLSLPEDQYRKITIAGLESESTLSPDQLSILGLSFDKSFDEVVDWAVENNFAMFSFEDKKSEPRIGVEGGKTIKEMIAEENKPSGGILGTSKASYYPRLYVGSDERSFQIQLVKGGWAGAREFADGGAYSIFGSNLDCLSPQNLGVKCGVIQFWGSDADDKTTPDSIRRITFAQSASGITREQVVAKLTEKYGPPSDNKSVSVFDTYRGNMLIWGRSRQHPDSENQIYFTRETWTQNWEVEAYIIEPSGDRITIITQINVFPPSDITTASEGNGTIKF